MMNNKINKILLFLRPEYFSVCIWLFFIRFIKLACEEIRKMNGNISNNKDGEFKRINKLENNIQC